MSTTTETREPILSARGIYKRYGNVTAIDGADFDLYPGEILAVIGDNGAGKSSLIKVLSGATIPDSGTVSLDGEEVSFKSPLEARRAVVAHPRHDAGQVGAQVGALSGLAGGGERGSAILCHLVDHAARRSDGQRCSS